MVSECMKLPESGIISMVGGGGKTSVLFQWAQELRAAGKTVIVTTTTHMFDPEVAPEDQRPPFPWVLEASEEKILQMLQQSGVVLVGMKDPHKPGKIKGFEDSFFHKLSSMAQVVLVEADGSRRCPVKMPTSWEPVVPEASAMTVCVAGLSCLGRPIRECAYESLAVAEFLGKNQDDFLEEDDLVRLLSSEMVGRKNCAGIYRVILNQADTVERQEAAERILEALKEQGIHGIWRTRREHVGLILLAAGNSTRFQGNKLCYRMKDGRPLYRHVVDALMAVDIHHRVVVTQYEEVESDLAALGYQVVKNPHPEWGISHSIRLGVEAAGQVDGYLFCVCDQPGIRGEMIERIIEVWKSGRESIVGASRDGIIGNPNLFSSYYKEELQNIQGDRGGKVVMKRWPREVTSVEVDEAWELVDIDDREALNQWENKQENFLIGLPEGVPGFP